MNEESSPQTPPGGPVGVDLPSLLDSLQQQEDYNAQCFAALRQNLVVLMQQMAESPSGAASPPVATRAAAVPPVGSEDSAAWERALLGPVCDAPAIAPHCQILLAGLLGGQPAAIGLIGALLTFRAATAEKMPRLLSVVGEAYYRWRPGRGSGADPFREALIGWLESCCQSHGVPNRIKVVQGGDRFDATRHNTKDRGIEVSEVMGWVVLRDNGKVFSKATVALK